MLPILLDEKMKFINYAHRGYSELYPENTLYSFYMGLNTGANGIETDIQRTKDGVLVLFHDDDLFRILGIHGKIADYSYKELLAMDFGKFKGTRFVNEKIVTLEEFLTHFGDKDLVFALEIKQFGVEKQMLEMIDKMNLRNKVIITSFVWESLMEVRKYDKTINVGYLVEKVDDTVISKLLENNIQQVCPRIDYFNEDLYCKCRDLNISIRYWGISDNGVSDPVRMKRALNLGSDGMTINDPTLLQKALGL